jgi:hypothetical protein
MISLMQQDRCNLENRAYVMFKCFGSGSGSSVEEEEVGVSIFGSMKEKLKFRDGRSSSSQHRCSTTSPQNHHFTHSPTASPTPSQLQQEHYHIT